MFGVEKYTKEQLKRASDELLKELEVEDPEASPPEPTKGVVGSDTTVSTSTDNITTEGAETPAGHDHDRSGHPDVWNTPEDRIAGLARFLDGYFRYVDSKWQPIPCYDYFVKVMAVKFVPDENGFAKKAKKGDPSVPVKFHWYKVSDSAERAKMARQIIKGNDKGWQMYLTNNVTRINKGNGSEKDIALVLSTVADIDCASKARPNSEGKVQAPDLETAVSWLPCKPTFTVYTGHGIQAFNVFSDPQAPTADSKKLNEDYIRAIKQRANSGSISYAGIDSVAALWHYFRCPYTYNYRDGFNQNHLATVDDLNGCYWQYDEFKTAVEQALTVEQEQADEQGDPVEQPTVSTKDIPTSTVADKTDYPPALNEWLAEQLLNEIDPKGLGESDWWSVYSGCKGAGLDKAIADAWCMLDPERYDEKENQDRWDRADISEYNIKNLVGKVDGSIVRKLVAQWYSEHPEASNSSRGRRHKDNGSDNGNSDTSKRLDIIFCASKANDQGVCNVFVNAYRDRLKVLSDVSAPKSNKLVGLMVYKETTDIDPVTGEVYTGGVWCPADFKVLLNMVKKLAERLEKIAETELQKKIVDALNDARKIDRVLDLISGDDTLWIRSDKFDNHPELLNVANGVVNLNDGKLYPPDPGLLLTKQISIPYLPDEKCPVFDGFLASSIPNNDTRAYLLSLLGYCLDGEYTEQGVWIWSGSGGNGKGTCLNIVSEITGNYCSVLPMSLFTKGTVLNDPNKPSPVIAGLRNCRFAYAQENQPGDQWNVANVKTLSGGDQLPYTLKYSNEPQRIKNPQHTLILNVGQYKPDMFDAHDGGLGSRFFVIQWYQQFRNSKGDPNLKKKLMAELPGILAQLVHEAMLNRQRGNGSPKLRPVSAEMDCAKNGYFNANDWLAEFIDENYDTEEDPELQKPIPVSVVLKNIKAQLPDKIAVFGNSWKVEIKRMLAELGYEAEDGSHARQKVYKTLKYRSGR